MSIADEYIKPKRSGGRPHGSKERYVVISKMTQICWDILDVVLAESLTSQIEIAERFKVSRVYVCRIINSPIFQDCLRERRSKLVDESLARRLNKQIRGVTIQALDILSRRMDETDDSKVALQALIACHRALFESGGR